MIKADRRRKKKYHGARSKKKGEHQAGDPNGLII
jgi:hypothetical protein